MGAGLGQVGSRTLSSAWQGDQGTPRVSGTAWVGNGRFHEGQCRGKEIGRASCRERV